MLYGIKVKDFFVATLAYVKKVLDEKQNNSKVEKQQFGKTHLELRNITRNQCPEIGDLNRSLPCTLGFRMRQLFI